MRKRWFKVVVIVVLILLPVGIWMFGPDMIERLYRQKTDYPETITIAAGSEGGRYRVISKRLEAEIENKISVDVEILRTEGSLENILRLQAGDAHFALYQPGAIEVLSEHDRDLVESAAARLESPKEEEENVAFVANLYLHLTHFIVHRGADIERPADLEGKTVSVGLPQSGDYAMSLLLLEHFGLTKESIIKMHL